MNKYDHQDPSASVCTLSKRARLQALLFAGATFGTALLTLCGQDVKIPPFKGE